MLILLAAFIDSLGYSQAALDRDSEKVMAAIVTDSAGEGTAFVVHDAVDESRLAAVASKGYENLKSELGVRNDFVILFTNGGDEVVPIGDVTCLGSPDARVAGKNCR